MEGEDLTIYGNVGNAIDINGGATAKEIAASITARKVKLVLDAHEHDFSEVCLPERATVCMVRMTLIAANVDFGRCSATCQS